jgi:hypothetical protein
VAHHLACDAKSRHERDKRVGLGHEPDDAASSGRFGLPEHADDPGLPANLWSLEVLVRGQQATIQLLRQRVRELEQELDILLEYLRSVRSGEIPDSLTLKFAERGWPGCGQDPD